MPSLTVWSIRAALLYLALGFTFGALLLWNKGIPLTGALWSLLPAHIDFLLFGWTVQLIMGMAFWILPRYKKPPKRGNERVAWAAVILLNAGIWLVGIVPLLVSSPWLIAAGRAAQILASILFMAHAWPRIKPAGV